MQPLSEEMPAREADVVARDRAERGREDDELDAQAAGAATTPAAIAVASLGTSGKNASSIATTKTTR